MSYHARIMNIQAYEFGGPQYKLGHRDARHAAAEIAAEAEAEVERLTAERDALADLLRVLIADRDYRMLDRNLERAEDMLAALPTPPEADA